MNDTTQATPEESVKDVQEEVSQTQPDNTADVEEQSVDVDESSTDDYKHKFESIKGKVSALEREKNQLQNAARMLEALNNAAAKDPKFMREANKKLVEQGLLDPSVLEGLEEPEEDTSKEKTTKKSTDAPSLSPDLLSTHPAIQWARQKQMEEQQQEVKFFQDFESNKPDLLEGTQDQIRARRGAIAANAIVNQQSGMSKKDAFEKAYVQVLHPEKLREEGELDGIVKAQSSSPSIGSASGQSARVGRKVELTPEQQKVADTFKMTPEEYSDWASNADKNFDSLK